MRRAAAVVIASVLAFGFGTAPTRDEGPVAGRPPVVVASFDFTESVLVAHLYARALREAGVPARTELRVGPRELVWPALERHLVDVVPEYIGSALDAIAPGGAVDRHDATAVYEQLAAVVQHSRLAVLEAAPAQNQNAFAIRRADAERRGLHAVSDLARLPGGVVLGGPRECTRRTYCLLGLESTYGITIRRFVPLEGQSQALAALDEGVVDVAVLFTTDGALADADVAALVDDRNLQPVDHIAPIVSERAIDRYGDAITTTLNEVSALLTSEALRFLNWRVTFDGKSPRTEARRWLQRQGLLGPGR